MATSAANAGVARAPAMQNEVDLGCGVGYYK
jgi:hypothetical protein